MRYRVLAMAVLAAAAPAAAPAQGGDIPPMPYAEIVQAPAEPFSVFCTPGGHGAGFADAQVFGGAAVDGTLVIAFWTDTPDWGEPLVNYPAEDIWMESTTGSLVACLGGTNPDADTDDQGRTTWALPLRVAGHLDPDGGDGLRILLGGTEASGLETLGLHLNSADLNADGHVNLTDGAMFTQDLFGSYAYRSDFVWDGVINLSDVGRMAQAMGDECP